jgi:nucleoside-diphosphate-sugar epimerase
MHSTPVLPPRVVVLGAGFVGGALSRRLMQAGADVLALGRAKIDLLSDGAAAALAALLRPTDTLVVVSAEAPVKTAAMLERNIRMAAAVCAAFEMVMPAHVVYVSSDAVYGDSTAPLDEASPAEPGSLHGTMHLARELMLKNTYRGPLAIVRPTLIYGAADPHNGYGPNKFIRLALQGEDIVLFGDGEERRDHVLVDDVAEVLALVVLHRSHGIVNAATGTVTSFNDLAHQVVTLAGRKNQVRSTPRSGPMPHGGYRAFDAAVTKAAFPGFSYTKVADGLAKTHRAMAART